MKNIFIITLLCFFSNNIYSQFVDSIYVGSEKRYIYETPINFFKEKLGVDITGKNDSVMVVRNDGKGFDLVDGNSLGGSLWKFGQYGTITPVDGTKKLTIGTENPSFDGDIVIGGTEAVLMLNGSTASRIRWSNSGYGFPSFNSFSNGTKFVLSGSPSATETGYSMGIATSTLWFTLADNNADKNYSFYGGTDLVYQLYGNGKVSFKKYGINTFVGTPAKYLAVEADGDLVEVGIPVDQNIYKDNGILTGSRTVDLGTNTINFQNGNVGIGNLNPTEQLHVSNGNVLINQNVAKISMGEQGNNGDVHFGSSGLGSPTFGSQDYGGYFAHNAFRQSDGAWKHSRTNAIPAVRLLMSGGVSGGNQGFSFDYSTNQGTGNITWDNLLQIAPNGNMTFSKYGSGTITGTAAKYLAVESDGDVIEVDAPTGGSVDTLNEIATKYDLETFEPDFFDIKQNFVSNDVTDTMTTSTILNAAIKLGYKAGEFATANGTEVTGQTANVLIGSNAGQNLVGLESNVGIGKYSLWKFKGKRAVAIGRDAFKVSISEGCWSLEDNEIINPTGVGYNIGQYNRADFFSGLGSDFGANNTGENLSGVGFGGAYYNDWDNNTILGVGAHPFREDVSNLLSITGGNINTDSLWFTGATSLITYLSTVGKVQGDYINLKFKVVSGTPPTGMPNNRIYQVRILNGDTLKLDFNALGGSISGIGIGSFQLVPQLHFENISLIGANTIPNNSNQFGSNLFLVKNDDAYVTGDILVHDGTQFVKGAERTASQGIVNNGGNYEFGSNNVGTAKITNRRYLGTNSGNGSIQLTGGGSLLLGGISTKTPAGALDVEGGIVTDAFLVRNNATNGGFFEVDAQESTSEIYMDFYRGSDGAGARPLVFRAGLNGTPVMKMVGALWMEFSEYGNGTITGTEAYSLSVDATGKIIEVDPAAGMDAVVANRSYVDNTAALVDLSSGQVYYNTTSNAFVVLP
jgi:hypothetical protein